MKMLKAVLLILLKTTNNINVPQETGSIKHITEWNNVQPLEKNRYFNSDDDDDESS